MAEIATNKIIALIIGILVLLSTVALLWTFYPKIKNAITEIGADDLAEAIQNHIDKDTGAVLENIPTNPDEITPSEQLSGDCSGPLVATGYNCWGGCKIRESLIPRLREAEKIAQSKGVTLQVNSAWRSEQNQKDTWKIKGPSLACGPDKSGSYAHCPHVLGCALDVSLKGSKDTKLREQIMYEAGFIRYCGEQWHFEYGTRLWVRGVDKGTKCA